MTIFSLLLMLVLTGINNWAIPVAIYAAKFGLFKKRPAKFVGCNSWGIVMDVILAGLINVVTLNYLLAVAPKVTGKDFLAAFVLGLAATVVVHIFMAATFWKEWIMPRPWHWNLGGYWHLVSMTLQFSFGFYPLVMFYRQPPLLKLPLTQMTLLLVAILGILFLAALAHKDRDLKIGPWNISAKTW